jgi:hypothetical protein
MAQTLTNNTGSRFARESSLGVLSGSPDWKNLEPNSFGQVGAQTSQVERSPITPNRQRQKGTIVDLDATYNIEADTTFDVFADMLEAFLFAQAVNYDLVWRAANQTGTAFTIAAASTAQAAKVQFTSGGPITLLYAKGYALAANNGLFPLTVDLAGSGTALTVGTGAAETAPANAEVAVAGIRAEAGDLALSISSGVGTLSSGNNSASNSINFTTLGLTVGQRVHVGGLTSTNRFGSTAAGDGTRSFGSARITAIAAGSLTLDKIDATLVASDGTDDGTAGALIPVDLLYGRFIRNVPVTHADYNRYSHTFETSIPNLFETDPPSPVADPDGFEYVLGAVANVWTWNMPLTSKSTSSFGFVATDAEDPVDNASRKSGASTARDPLFTGALNTSTNFFRLGITDVDETGLTTDFKNVTVELNNGVTPEKVLGTLGARYINIGNFLVSITAEALFTKAEVPARIRANTTVTMDWVLTNDDGAIAVDIPSATIGDGAKSYPVNESVRINLQVNAFEDDVFGTSIGVSLFAVFPTS